MSDRLTELQRQRALALEQLAWIEREITRESGQAQVPVPAAAPGPVTPPVPAPTGVPPDVARTAEEILAQYRAPAESTTKDVKKGCYLYFIFALGVLVLFAVGAYYVYVSLQ